MRFPRLTCIALLLALLSAPSLAIATQPPPPTPDAVLEEESRALRTFVMEDDAFLSRMENYREYADLLGGLSAHLVEWEPYLVYLDELVDLDKMGMLTMLSAVDSRFAFVQPLIQGLTGVRGVLKAVTAFGAKLQVMTLDFDKILTQPRLSPQELGSIRASLPAGQEAILEVQAAYNDIRPTLDDFETQISAMRTELTQSIREMSGMLGIVGGVDVQKEVDMAFELVFGIKHDLDDLAQHAKADVERLKALENRIQDAEAHHTYALAEAQLTAGQTDQARNTLGLVQQLYPLSPWADRARDRLSNLDNPALANIATASGNTLDASVASNSGSGNDNRGLWALLIIALSLGGAAFVIRKLGPGASSDA